MSEFIKQRIEVLSTKRDDFADEAIEAYRALLKAEEALRTADARKNRTGYTFWVDIVKVEEALSSIEALWK